MNVTKYVFVAVIALILMFWLLDHCNSTKKYNVLTESYVTLQTEYIELMESKTQTDTIKTEKIVYIRAKPTIVVDSLYITDTVYTNKPLLLRTYVDTIYQDGVKTVYTAVTLGWLRDLALATTVPHYEIHTSSIVEKEVLVYKDKGRFSIGAGMGYPASYYGSLSYTPKHISYRASCFVVDKQRYYLGGIDINF